MFRYVSLGCMYHITAHSFLFEGHIRNMAFGLRSKILYFDKRGVFLLACQPGKAGGHVFRESVPLGSVPRRGEIQPLLRSQPVPHRSSELPDVELWHLLQIGSPHALGAQNPASCEALPVPLAVPLGGDHHGHGLPPGLKQHEDDRGQRWRANKAFTFSARPCACCRVT